MSLTEFSVPLLPKPQFHDLKEGGDRTLNELKEHARQLYNEQGKTMPKWLR